MLNGHYPIARLTRSFKRALINAGVLQTHDIKLEQDDGRIHIYSDGSYGRKTQRIGMGWVIKTSSPDDEFLFSDSHERILSPAGNEIPSETQNVGAEVMAATNALNCLPNNSNVLLHSDLGDIIVFVNRRKLLDVKRNKDFHLQWIDLEKAIDRHKKVIAEYSNDKEKDNKIPFETTRIMRLAHNLAATGSGAKTQKPLLGDDKEKYGSFFADHTPVRKQGQSTDLSNIVYDPEAFEADEVQDIDFDDPFGPVIG